jgi:hypothetical protein
MNDPVSMLDWGLQHLWEDLRDSFPPTDPVGPVTGHPTFGVDYKFANQIEVSVLFVGPETYAGSAKEACKGVLNDVRGHLRIDIGDKKVLYPWTDDFTHNGFTMAKGADKKLADELPRLVTIRVSLFAPQRQECFGPLIGDTVAYEEK